MPVIFLNPALIESK